MRKTALVMITILMLMTGISFAVSPLILSMEPSAKAKSERSRHNISSLQRGQFLFEHFERANPWNQAVLIIRDWDGTVYSYLVPMEDNRVLMPDMYWGRTVYDCTDFGPEIEISGRIKASGVIKCHDPDVQAWWRDHWRWSYNGQTIHPPMGNMYSPDHEIQGEYLFINL